MFKVPEQFRNNDTPAFATLPGEPFGAFSIPYRGPDVPFQTTLVCIASNGMDGVVEWEHVSLRAERNINGRNVTQTPRWEEMNYVKSLFWDDEDVVVQFHPKKTEYVNLDNHVLHLWRPINEVMPTPPTIAV